MKFNPNDVYGCLPEGEYDATIASVDEKESKAGAPMVVVTLEVYDGPGTPTKLKEYIVGPGGGKRGNLFKLKGIAAALGRPADEWKSGDTAWLDACVGRNVRVVLSIREQPGYEPSNQIEEYKQTGSTAAPRPAATREPKPSRAATNFAPVAEEDIPF